MRQQLHLALDEKDNRCCCCVRTDIVMMKKKATESSLWAALAPNFEDPRETVTHVPVRSDYSPVFKRNAGDIARFFEETGNHFLLPAALPFEFVERGLVQKQPDR